MKLNRILRIGSAFVPQVREWYWPFWSTLQYSDLGVPGSFIHPMRCRYSTEAEARKAISEFRARQHENRYTDEIFRG